MLKVLILSRDLKMTGGVANLVRMISEKFSDKVQSHHFFIGKALNSDHLRSSVFKPLLDAVFLYKKTRFNQYDVIHINPSLDTKSVLRDGLFMLIISKLRNNNTLVYFHGWEEGLAQFIVNSKILSFLMRSTFGQAKKIIVLAGSFAKQLVDMGFDEKRILTFYTMFDGTIFDGLEKQKDKDEIIILFMSRFVAAKGIFELLDAFNKVQLHKSIATLYLTGDGPEKAAIRQKISELGLDNNVKLLGYIRGKEKAQALLNADIFILPSYSEGCPISLLEAMAAGLPVITTAVGGIPDIVTNGINGVLLESHAPDAIEKGIEKMLENEVERRKIGEFNRKTAWEKYEASVVTAKIEQIYAEVAGEI